MFPRHISETQPAFHVVHDRIAIRDVFDDVGSKYVPLHVIECSWIGASASRFCVWPSHARH